MRCTYCDYDPSFRHSSSSHHEACPGNGGLNAATAKEWRNQWQIGYRDGASGEDMHPVDRENARYRLGYGQGLIALEERENGYNPYALGNDPGPEG